MTRLAFYRTTSRHALQALLHIKKPVAARDGWRSISAASHCQRRVMKTAAIIRDADLEAGRFNDECNPHPGGMGMF